MQLFIWKVVPGSLKRKKNEGEGKLRSELIRATVREAEDPPARALYETLRIYLLGHREPGVIILNWLIPLRVLNPWHSQDALKVPS